MPLRTGYNPKALITTFLIILLLYVSWVASPTCFLWKLLDDRCFFFLNSLLGRGTAHQNFWAFANHRMMDWIHDLSMTCFFLFYIFKGPKKLKLYRTGEFLFTIALFATTIVLINKTLIQDNYKILRDSPSLKYPFCYRLSELVDWIYVKDYSRCSFPSDHGTTATLFTGAIFIVMGWRPGMLALLYGIFFSLPRLVVGAHWLTDVLIGSMTITLPMLALGYFTPLCKLFSIGFDKLFQRKEPYEPRQL
ncbi:MAG: phosphatase PAP2 family protein [Simkaniaceae bacterium]